MVYCNLFNIFYKQNHANKQTNKKNELNWKWSGILFQGMPYLFIKIQILLVILKSGEIAVNLIQTQDRIQTLVVVALAVRGKHQQWNYKPYITNKQQNELRFTSYDNNNLNPHKLKIGSGNHVAVAFTEQTCIEWIQVLGNQTYTEPKIISHY